MFTNRTPDGRNNIAGIKVAELRKNLRISQRELADRLAVIGLDIDKNAVQRMESGIDFSFQSKKFGIMNAEFGMNVSRFAGRI